MGIVYKVTNRKDGSAYIGATTMSLKERKSSHVKQAKRYPNHHFYSQLLLLGKDAFDWEVIEKCESNEELIEKETFYIQTATMPIYNVKPGGEGIARSVWQFECSGDLVNHYQSVREAAKSTEMDFSRIAAVCRNSTGYYNGFIWSYSDTICYNHKLVYQLTIENEAINAVYNTISEASRETGINKSSIAKVCRGERKTAGGFIWRKE